MAAPQQGPESRLQIRRTFAAPRDKVFRAWTERKALEQWMCRDNPANSTRYTAFDVRPGGSNRMEIRTADGSVYHQLVTFREVTPPEKLVFTWAWERYNPSGVKDEVQKETVVTVELFALGNSTDVILTQEFFPNAEIRDRHLKGWNGCFDVLENVLQSGKSF
jgi:uncharacterized protein YndB with AHSA1/START domain